MYFYYTLNNDLMLSAETITNVHILFRNILIQKENKDIFRNSFINITNSINFCFTFLVKYLLIISFLSGYHFIICFYHNTGLMMMMTR